MRLVIITPCPEQFRADQISKQKSGKLGIAITTLGPQISLTGVRVRVGVRVGVGARVVGAGARVTVGVVGVGIGFSI